MTDACVAFGGNLGDPPAMFREVAKELASLASDRVVASSPLFQTRPVGGPAGQSEYWNGCYRFATELGPTQLLGQLRAIEHRHGRRREQRWDARPIDLDLLLCGSAIVASEEKVLPHPRMHYRSFALGPAAALAADLVHPLLGLTIGELWRRAQSATASLMLVGGSPATVDWARERWLARSPNGLLSHCLPQSRALTILSLGAEMIGIGTTSASADWAAALEWERNANLEAPTAVLTPACDCRGPDDATVRAKLELFLDSLATPSAILPMGVPSVG